MNRAQHDWHERMVAALYGEMEEDERREFDTAIAGDETLAIEWEELRHARALLASHLVAASEDEDPYLLPAEILPKRSLQRASVVPFRSWVTASGIGFAAAAVLFVVLLIGGLRMDRTSDGLLLAFGHGSTATGANQPRSADVLTREEFADFARVMIGATAERFDELERRQANVQAEVAQALFDALSQSQLRQYDDLRARIELASFAGATANPLGAMPGEPHINRPMGQGENHDYQRN